MTNMEKNQNKALWIFPNFKETIDTIPQKYRGRAWEVLIEYGFSGEINLDGENKYIQIVVKSLMPLMRLRGVGGSIGGKSNNPSGKKKANVAANVDANVAANVAATLYKQEQEQEKEQEEEQEKEQEEKISKKKIDELFAVFYTAYPRKTGRTEARKKYEVALKRDSAEKILNGVKQYCKEINANKIEKQFIKHPSTWLNQQCWLDYEDIGEPKLVDDYEQRMTDECYERMLRDGQITEDEFKRYWENRGKVVTWQ